MNKADIVKVKALIGLEWLMGREDVVERTLNDCDLTMSKGTCADPFPTQFQIDNTLIPKVFWKRQLFRVLFNCPSDRQKLPLP